MGRTWPTPTGVDAQSSGGKELGTNVTLTDAAVRMWPTPKTTDCVSASPGDGNRSDPGLRYQATRPDGTDGERKADLNPRFVAALMGVPWDWLNPCTSVATDSFHEWQQKHSPNWRLELESA